MKYLGPSSWRIDVPKGIERGTFLNMAWIFSFIEGSLGSVSSNIGSSSYDSYGYSDASGTVEMVVPSGDSFYSDFYGECYTGAYQGISLYWDMSVQTPGGERYFSAQLYSY